MASDGPDVTGVGRDWVLAMDFGTTNSAVAYSTTSREGRVPKRGEYPSAVFARDHEHLVVAEAAENFALMDPGRFTRTPKRFIGDGTLRLGGEDFQPTEVVAAVLREGMTRAASENDGVPPSETRLTYPASWGDHLKSRLFEAASMAELPNVALVPEPVAAASHYISTFTEVGPFVSVFDLGGGTLDITVLDMSGSAGPEVVATGGRIDIGGESFDDALWWWLIGELEALGHDELAQALADGDDSHDDTRYNLLRAQLTLRDRLRTSKHHLSDHPSSQLWVEAAGMSTEFTVTRNHLESVIMPSLDEAVAELDRVLGLVGGPNKISALFLTGGACYTPAVADTIVDRVGLRPARFDNPKTVTVTGALSVPLELLERDRPADTMATLRSLHFPDLGHNALLTEWLVEPGQSVVGGEILAKIEVDGNAISVHACVDGKLPPVLATPGERLAAGDRWLTLTAGSQQAVGSSDRPTGVPEHLEDLIATVLEDSGYQRSDVQLDNGSPVWSGHGTKGIGIAVGIALDESPEASLKRLGAAAVFLGSGKGTGVLVVLNENAPSLLGSRGVSVWRVSLTGVLTDRLPEEPKLSRLRDALNEAITGAWLPK